MIFGTPGISGPFDFVARRQALMRKVRAAPKRRGSGGLTKFRNVGQMIRAQAKAARKQAKAVVAAQRKSVAGKQVVATRFPGQPCPPDTVGVQRGRKVLCYR